MAEHSDRERAISAVIRGRVQGVGYRFTTQRVGQQLGLAGWVRNEADGSVRLQAQGDRETITRFIRFLEKGPPAARVSAVEVAELPVDSAIAGFNVRY